MFGTRFNVLFQYIGSMMLCFNVLLKCCVLYIMSLSCFSVAAISCLNVLFWYIVSTSWFNVVLLHCLYILVSYVASICCFSLFVWYSVWICSFNILFQYPVSLSSCTTWSEKFGSCYKTIVVYLNSPCRRREQNAWRTHSENIIIKANS